MKKTIQLIILAGVLALIAGCGGGSSSSDGDESTTMLNPCGTVIDISPNGIFEGELGSGDCRLSNLLGPTSDSSLVDEYSVTLPSSGTLEIHMRSSGIDPVLFLFNRSTSCLNIFCDASQLLAFNDDFPAPNRNSYISIDLPAGTYLILADTYSPRRQASKYTIETIFE